MPVMPWQAQPRLFQAINDLAHSVEVCTIPQPRFTYDEIMELFVRPDHRTILKEARVVAHTGRSSGSFSIHMLQNNRITFVISFVGDEAPLVPRYPEFQNVRTPAYYRLLQYTEAKMEHGRNWGLVRWAVDELVGRCETGAQLRYLFPAVLQLCPDKENQFDPGLNALYKWAVRNAAFKAQSSVPNLTPSLKAAIRDAGAFVTTAKLLDLSTAVAEDAHEVVMKMTLPNFDYHGTNIARL